MLSCEIYSLVQDPFGAMDLAFLKVVDMMVGEMEYTRFFVEQDLYLPDLTRTIFVIFCITIPIVLMNLLVSQLIATLGVRGCSAFSLIQPDRGPKEPSTRGRVGVVSEKLSLAHT